MKISRKVWIVFRNQTNRQKTDENIIGFSDYDSNLTFSNFSCLFRQNTPLRQAEAKRKTPAIGAKTTAR